MPGLATITGRIGALRRGMQPCVDPVALEPPSALEHPVQLNVVGFAADLSANLTLMDPVPAWALEDRRDAIGLHAGAVLCNAALVVGFPVAVFVLGALPRLALTAARRSRRDAQPPQGPDAGAAQPTPLAEENGGWKRQAVKAAVTWARLPGVSVMAVSYFVQPLTVSSVALCAIVEATALGKVIGGVGIAFVVLLLAVAVLAFALYFRVVFHFVDTEGGADEKVEVSDPLAIDDTVVDPFAVDALDQLLTDEPLPKRQKKGGLRRYLFNERGNWENHGAALRLLDLLRRFGMFFDAYRYSWFLLVELIAAFAGGVVSGIRIVVGCQTGSILDLLVNALLTLSYVVLRPHIRRMELALQLVVQAPMTVAALLAVLGQSDSVGGVDDRELMQSIGSMLVDFSSAMSTLLGVYALVMLAYHQLKIRWRKRRRSTNDDATAGDALTVTTAAFESPLVEITTDPEMDEASSDVSTPRPPALPARENAAMLPAARPGVVVLGQLNPLRGAYRPAIHAHIPHADHDDAVDYDQRVPLDFIDQLLQDTSPPPLQPELADFGI